MPTEAKTLACPECQAPVELSAEAEYLVCIYCGTVSRPGTDEDGDPALSAVGTDLPGDARQAIAASLRRQIDAATKSLTERQERLKKVEREIKAEEEREIALLPNPAKRNANILILSTVVLLAVLIANLFGKGGQIVGLSIFTVIVFVAILAWMLFTYFTSQRSAHISGIRQNYRNEFEQVSQDATREVEKLERSISLANVQLKRFEG